jgi:photosystem II stability/assembly factor-like uncharacterized protein
MAIDPADPTHVFGAAQDNGVVRTTTGGTSDWGAIYGGDGLGVLVDPTSSATVYAESQNGDLEKSTDGAMNFSPSAPSPDRVNWGAPFALDPNAHDTLWFGGESMYRSTDGGATWKKVSQDLSDGPIPDRPSAGTITTIATSGADSNTAYAGTDDGNVWLTRDAGATWTKITTGLPKRYVTRLAAEAGDATHAYVTFSGFGLEPGQSHVYRTEDAGATWVSIGGSLPPLPVDTILLDTRKGAEGTIYVGADAGVFVTHDLGASWNALGSGLPLAPVLDLAFDPKSGTLFAATHGRSMYSLHVGL